MFSGTRTPAAAPSTTEPSSIASTNLALDAVSPSVVRPSTATSTEADTVTAGAGSATANLGNTSGGGDDLGGLGGEGDQAVVPVMRPTEEVSEQEPPAPSEYGPAAATRSGVDHAGAREAGGERGIAVLPPGEAPGERAEGGDHRGGPLPKLIGKREREPAVVVDKAREPVGQGGGEGTAWGGGVHVEDEAAVRAGGGGREEVGGGGEHAEDWVFRGRCAVCPVSSLLSCPANEGAGSRCVSPLWSQARGHISLDGVHGPLCHPHIPPRGTGKIRTFRYTGKIRMFRHTGKIRMFRYTGKIRTFRSQQRPYSRCRAERWLRGPIEVRVAITQSFPHSVSRQWWRS